MLDSYFCAPKTLRRLRAGPSGPYMDGFADVLERDGYAHASAVRYLRAAAHLGCFVHLKGGTWADVDAGALAAFGRHFPRCRCPRSNGGATGYHARFGTKLFHRHLVGLRVCECPGVAADEQAEPALVIAFRDWLRAHRGARDATLRQYCCGATELIDELGADVANWNAQSVRGFLLGRAAKCGRSTTLHLITSMRAFLRYVSFTGESRDDLALAVPAVASWRLARLPRCLAEDELVRLIAACDGTTRGRLRDRAIVLLLSRPGLRAGDVARLRLNDIDWRNGTVRVTGKGRYEVGLPLPQDVGDALLAYLARRPAGGNSDHVFLRSRAPSAPFADGDGVSSVVRHALQRAGVKAPIKGAHVLRHTAATQMLRSGVPLDQIGLVLRHRSLDMSAYYAKVDVALLRGVAQPWPGVHP
jgi:integrase